MALMEEEEECPLKAAKLSLRGSERSLMIGAKTKTTVVEGLVPMVQELSYLDMLSLLPAFRL